MPNVNTREKFRDNIRRRLGEPVIDLNMDDDQLEDRIDEALEYWNQFHDDGSERSFLSYELQQTDVDNRYITLPSTVKNVYRVLPVTSGSSITNNMFDLRYQIRLNDIYDFSNTTFTYWYLMNRKLREIELYFSGEVGIRFNRFRHKIYLDTDWETKFTVGEYLVFEVIMYVDPEELTESWNSLMLQRYAAALVKKQWGTNLKKYSGVQIIGGVTFDGQTIFNEADQEVKDIEEEIRKTYETPPMMICG